MLRGVWKLSPEPTPLAVLTKLFIFYPVQRDVFALQVSRRRGVWIRLICFKCKPKYPLKSDPTHTLFLSKCQRKQAYSYKKKSLWNLFRIKYIAVEIDLPHNPWPFLFNLSPLILDSGEEIPYLFYRQPHMEELHMGNYSVLVRNGLRKYCCPHEYN